MITGTIVPPRGSQEGPPDPAVRGRGEERGLELATSRAGRLGGLDPTKAFARLSSLLVRRGYDADVARRAARRALAIDGLED
jgi:hypothetical protein